MPPDKIAPTFAVGLALTLTEYEGCSAIHLQRYRTVRATSAAVLTRRPSVFQAGHIPSWQKSCESYSLSPVADDSGWLLLLLSPLLSAAGLFPISAVSRLMTA